MSILYDEKKPKRIAMPHMIKNELLETCKAIKEGAPGKEVKTTTAAKTGKKLTKKEQAKLDAKKASSDAIAKLLSKEPTVKRVREYLTERVKELCED